MTNDSIKNSVKAVIFILIGLISLFVVSRYATSIELHRKTIESLDSKKTTVMELTAASTAASAAVTLLPGDTATPIAEKLADLSSYFLMVICALYLEKYLVMITWYAAFGLLIPAACVVCSVNVFRKNDSLKLLAKKLLIFGIAIVLVMPVSTKVSDLIEASYGESMEQTIESAKQTVEEIDTDTAEEGDGWIPGIISTVKDSVTEVTEKVENVLNNFIDALAIMIVTSCIIPILVLMFFTGLVKMMLGINIQLPKKIPGISDFIKEKK